MGIFRSHLFPHLTYLAGLTIVCIIGLSGLSDAQDDFSAYQKNRQNAIALIDPIPKPSNGVPTNRSPLSLIVEKVAKARNHFLQMTNRRALYSIEGIEGARIDVLEADAEMLYDQLSTIHAEVVRLSPQVELLSNSRLAVNLSDTNSRFSQALAEKEGSKFFFAMEAINCDDKLEQLQSLLDDQIYSQALRDVKDSSEKQDGIFTRVKGRLSYTLVWLIIISAAYLYAVNTLLARPVKNLAEVARTVTAGRLLVRAEISTGGGPVAELCDDFNRMVDMLVKSLNEQQKSFTKAKARSDELQAANEHKNRFIANISHELKTPLNAVIGFADILMTAHHGPLSERQMDYLSRIFDAGKHLLAMICDLIDVMKLDLNALQLKPEEFDIRKMTKDVGELLLPQIEACKHTFTATIDPDLPAAFMDLTRYRQVIMNLLSNAIKFTPESGTIQLSLRQCDDMYQLKVVDNGIGISKKDQRRIFQDFIQLDSKLHRKHEGTGIGLPLTRRLVDLMGGKMTVESHPGKGSTFAVTLPFKYVPLPPKELEKEKESRRVLTRKMSPYATNRVARDQLLQKPSG